MSFLISNAFFVFPCLENKKQSIFQIYMEEDSIIKKLLMIVALDHDDLADRFFDEEKSNSNYSVDLID